MTISNVGLDTPVWASHYNQVVNTINAFLDSGLNYMSAPQLSQQQKLDINTPQSGYLVWRNDNLQTYHNGRWYVLSKERADYDLSGQVTNTLSGSSETGVTVTVDDSLQSALSNGSGNYAISDVPKGASVSLTASKAGYNSWTGTVNISTSDAIKNIQIARRTLSGQVTSSSGGGAVSGASIQIPSLPRSTTSDGSGNFALIDVPDGNNYTVTASKAGYETVTNTAVDVNGNTTFNIFMQVISATVQGTITSSSTGGTAPSVALTMSGASATANTSGFYSIANVPQASGTLTATSDYFNTYTSTFTPNTSTYTKNFAMTPKQVSIRTSLGGGGTNDFNNRSHGIRISVSKTVKVTHYEVVNYKGSTSGWSFSIYNESGTAVVSGTALTSKTINSSGSTTIALPSAVTLSPGYYRITAYCFSTHLGNAGAGGSDTWLGGHPYVMYQNKGYYGSSGSMNYPSNDYASGVPHAFPISIKVEM